MPPQEPNEYEKRLEEFRNFPVYYVNITCGKCGNRFGGALSFSPRKTSYFICMKCMTILECPPSTSVMDLLKEWFGFEINKSGIVREDLMEHATENLK